MAHEIPNWLCHCQDSEIIGRGHNAREELQEAVVHAEVMAIEEIIFERGWRLLDTTYL